MFKTIIRTLSITALGVTLTALVPGAASAHSRHAQYHQPKSNIVETAVAINQQTGEFSTLIAAVSCTNLVNRLQNEHRQFTVFAPTDAAFAKLGLNAENVCTSFDRAALANILRYHVTKGRLASGDVLSQSELRMLNHQPAVIGGATIDGQNIVKTDVLASNGVIHVVDGVLLP